MYEEKETPSISLQVKSFVPPSCIGCSGMYGRMTPCVILFLCAIWPTTGPPLSLPPLPPRMRFPFLIKFTVRGE